MLKHLVQFKYSRVLGMTETRKPSEIQNPGYPLFMYFIFTVAESKTGKNSSSTQKARRVSLITQAGSAGSFPED